MSKRLVAFGTALFTAGLAVLANSSEQFGPKDDSYGSIAFSQHADGGYAAGIAWSHDSQTEATSSALKECRGQGGYACKRVGWFRNACGALAVGGANGFGTGGGETKAAAEAEALSTCKLGNASCRVIASECATVEEVAETSDASQTSTPRPSPSVGAEGDSYGSIAFSQQADGSYAAGIAWSYDSETEATASALEECRGQGGDNCKRVGWFRNACGALAVGGSNGFGTGWEETKAKAEQDALSECEFLNDDCQIVVSRCTELPEEETDAIQPEAPPEAVALTPRFVAIAERHVIDDCGDWGMAVSSDRQAAISQALAECGPNPPFPEGGALGIPYGYCTAQSLVLQGTCITMVKYRELGEGGSRGSCTYGLGPHGDSAEEAQQATWSACESMPWVDCLQILATRCVGQE